MCDVDFDSDRFHTVDPTTSVPEYAEYADSEGYDSVRQSDALEKGVADLAKSTLQDLANKGKTVACLVCADTPICSDALRASTGLPVFDALTCSEFFIKGKIDNPRFGLNDWQKS